jgi:SAM-dependent methyltransferase
MDSTQQLIALYHQSSKHSNYQVLPKCLVDLIPSGHLQVNSRHEEARMTFFRQHVEFKGKTVVDIGGNTGYFSFEAIASGAKKVTLIEGNTHHSQFVDAAAKLTKLDDRIDVRNEYFEFADGTMNQTPFDVMLLLNVLHHVGDDFDDPTVMRENALTLIARYLRGVAAVASTLIFQLGFNWKGDRNLPLFPNGTKRELVDFVIGAVRGTWDINAIGVATMVEDRILYTLLDDNNVKRNDALGEFLNRPIFVMSRVPDAV